MRSAKDAHADQNAAGQAAQDDDDAGQRPICDVQQIGQEQHDR
jgi:hypothetical protein